MYIKGLHSWYLVHLCIRIRRQECHSLKYLLVLLGQGGLSSLISGHCDLDLLVQDQVFPFLLNIIARSITYTCISKGLLVWYFDYICVTTRRSIANQLVIVILLLLLICGRTRQIFAYQYQVTVTFTCDYKIKIFGDFSNIIVRSIPYISKPLQALYFEHKTECSVPI